MYLWLLLLNSLVLARPYEEPNPRNDSDPAVITTDVTVSYSNGTNNLLSASSFHTLLYVESPVTSNTSLIGRTLQPRLMNQCRSRTAMFHSSVCVPQPPDRPGITRQYRIYCRDGHTISLHRAGVCGRKEMCFDSWGGQPDARHGVARCIPRTLFRWDSVDEDDDSEENDSEEDNSGHIGGEKRRKLDRGYALGGKQASVVISQADASTPVEVDRLEVNAVGKNPSIKTCQDCFEIRTKQLAPNTTELNVQASLISAGTVAAGVMWIALFSG